MRFVMAIVWLGAGIFAVEASETSPIPDTPSGRRFAELMAVMDSGDPDRLVAFVRGNFTAGMLGTRPNDDGIAPFLLAQQRDFGGFEVRRALKAVDAQVEMLVRPRKGSDRWLRYVLHVEPAPPHRVAGLFVFGAPPESIPAEGERLAVDAAVAGLEEDISALAASGKFSGAVLLARDGKPVLRRAWGEAERSFHTPNRPDTLFNLGSLNKMFTAVAIGKLVEKGKLGWDDPIGKHLDGWLPEDVAKKVTIRHLLTHASGLGDFLDAIRTGETRILLDGVAAHRRLAEGARPEFEPGSRFRYSNLGYLLLGAVIEAVAARDYYAFVRDEIFAPSGMPRSGSYSTDEVVENLAVGYLSPAEGGHPAKTNHSLRGLRGTPAGGGYSTCDELLAFASALTAHRLLAKDTTETLLAPHVTAPFGDYGFGFGIEKAPGGGTVVGHTGGFPGVSAVLRVYRDSGWTLCVLANASSGPGEIVGAWESRLARIGLD